MQHTTPQLFCSATISTCYPDLIQRYSEQICSFESIASLPDNLPCTQPAILIMDFTTAQQHSKQLEPLYIEYAHCYTAIVQAPVRLLSCANGQTAGRDTAGCDSTDIAGVLPVRMVS